MCRCSQRRSRRIQSPRRQACPRCNAIRPGSKVDKSAPVAVLGHSGQRGDVTHAVTKVPRQKEAPEVEVLLKLSEGQCSETMALEAYSTMHIMEARTDIALASTHERLAVFLNRESERNKMRSGWEAWL